MQRRARPTFGQILQQVNPRMRNASQFREFCPLVPVAHPYHTPELRGGPTKLSTDTRWIVGLRIWC
jgi:hypothetical protein